MKTIVICVAVAVLCGLALAQAPAVKPAPTPAQPADDISGMYTFLREGEYLQLNVDPQGEVTGVISRYSDPARDRGAFLDHLLDTATLQGAKLTFTTRPLHGIRYEFKGKVTRAPDKAPGAEGYHVLRGKLTQYVTNASQTTSAKTRDVEFKSFPADLSNPR